jgi:DNA-binding Lrp family transcriptional regulator
LRPSEHEYDRQILQAIASGGRITQRSLSGELGVALGLTNLLIRRLVAKGYVKMAGMGTRHVRYLMTAAGWEALGRASRLSLENTVRLYTQTREQIRATLSTLSDHCQSDEWGQKRVVFYGAGDVAEIAYVSLQTTDLTLVGVVDDRRRGLFFRMPICPSEQLSPEGVDGVPYAQIIVTSIRHAHVIEARIAARGIRSDRVALLEIRR